MQIPSLEEVRQYLKDRDNFLILMHIKPDGDSLASAYALLKFLLANGKKAVIGIEEEIFYKYKSFFPKEDRDEYFRKYSSLNKQTFEHIVVVDTSSFSLLGLFKDWVVERLERVLFLDHHVLLAPDSLEKAHCYIRQVSSASEIILDLIGNANLDFNMARALYMGIVFDTGQFRHIAASYEVFAKISILLRDFDVNKEDVYYYLFENETIGRKKLEGVLSSRVEFFSDGKIASAYLSINVIRELAKDGTVLSEDDMIDLTGVPHSLKGVLVSVMIRERSDQTTFSFRSRCEFDVADFASRFGGGGHKRASGLKMPHMSAKDIRETVLLPLQEAFSEWMEKESQKS